MTDDPARIDVSCLIKAPPERVFAAWTDPAIIADWFAPGPMRVAAADADPREGGRYRIAMVGPDQSPVVEGRYLEVTPCDRLAFTWAWVGDPSPATTVRLRFERVAAGTMLYLSHQRFETAGARNAHLAGWNDCLAKLAGRFAG